MVERTMVDSLTRRTLGPFVGVLMATGTLVVLGFVSLGFFTSLGGLIVAGTLAFVVGASFAAIVDVRSAARSAVIVAAFIVLLALAYEMVGGTGVESGAGVHGGPAAWPR